jgi:hypothetical protein
VSYEPPVRWKSDGGAPVAVNEGNDHRHRSQRKRSSRRERDRPGRRVSFQTGRYPGERRRSREVVAA